MSMTESEAREKLKCEYGVKISGTAKEASEFYIALGIAEKALEEIQPYRTIGTVSELRENKNFLEFLYNHIQPNEMEQYLAMYHALEEKGEQT